MQPGKGRPESSQLSTCWEIPSSDLNVSDRNISRLNTVLSAPLSFPGECLCTSLCFGFIWDRVSCGLKPHQFAMNQINKCTHFFIINQIKMNSFFGATDPSGMVSGAGKLSCQGGQQVSLPLRVMLLGLAGCFPRDCCFLFRTAECSSPPCVF